MRLAELKHRLGGSVLPIKGSGPEITGVHMDSRQVGAGDLFSALPGTRDAGSRHCLEALARGAVAILTPQALDLASLAERRVAEEPIAAALSAQWKRTPQWVHPQARRVAGEAAALVLGEPARGMFVAAVTGTNGKTTTAFLTGQLLAFAGRRPAVLGTAGHRLADGVLRPASHTTPDAAELQRLLALHRELGGDSVALEASSHALDQERLAGLAIDVAMFTNLTRDHLDYHGDLERYGQAKERLFAGLRPGAAAVVHADDPAGSRMALRAREAGARVFTYSARLRGDLVASRLESGLDGTRFVLHGMGISQARVCLPLAGRYNVENALAAALCALLSGASPSAIVDGLASVSSAPGRLEPVDTGTRGFRVFVDYAHTEDGLDNVCRVVRSTLADVRADTLDIGAAETHKDTRAFDGRAPRERTRGTTSAARGGRLIVVFGCGGDRDRGKRAPMGRIVNELADLAIVTSDNPRSEDPAAIIAEILAGMEPPRCELQIEVNRKIAIQRAIAAAREGDVVLIAGKGHESTQTIGRAVFEFDDRKVAAAALR